MTAGGAAPLRVVHSCTSLSYSGLERYVVDMAAAQHRAGIPVELYCREGGQIAREAGRRGVKLWLIAADQKPGPHLWWKERGEWRRRREEARGVGQRLVLHMHHHGELWFHKPWLGAVDKSILQFHLWITHGKKDPFHRWLYSGLSEVWCSSEAARAQLAAGLPVPQDRFRVVLYGRDLQRLQALPMEQLRRETRAKLGIEDDATVALTAARIEPIKGLRELFDAFAAVAPRHAGAHLVIVGGPSPENEEAAVFAAALSDSHRALPEALRRRIHFTGMAPSIDGYLAAADVYVLPSYEECMSLALLDALALGLPAVGTCSGGTPSVVKEGETGFLAEPRSAPALENALERFFSASAEDRGRLSVNARRLGAAHDERQVFEALLAAYGEGG